MNTGLTHKEVDIYPGGQVTSVEGGVTFNPRIPRLFLMPPSPGKGGGCQKDHPSQFYITDQRSTNLVCMCRSTNCLGICTIVYYSKRPFYILFG